MLFACIVAAPVPGVAQEATKLVVLTPRQGDVTEASARLLVAVEGGSESDVIRFIVTVDERPVDPRTGQLTSGEASAFSVPGGAQRRITLQRLPVGVHRLSVQALSPPGVAPDQVVFSVGPNPRRKGVSVPTAVVAVVLAVLLYLGRRRLLAASRRHGGTDEGSA